MIANRVASKVLWKAFYRRHAVPLGILGFFLLGLVKPPYLLFSGIFIRSLLLNPMPAFVVAAVCAAWAAYSTWSMQRAMRDPALAFLVNAGALGEGKLWWIAMQNVSMAGLLGFGYLGLMAYHAFTLHLGAGWVFAFGFGSAWTLLVWSMKRRIANLGSQQASANWLPSFRVSYFHLLRQLLWRSSRSALFVVKGFSLLFIALLVNAGAEAVLPQIAMLAFVVSGLLQSALTLLLRKEEIARLAWAKALPIPEWKRIMGYFLLHLFLQLPELCLLLAGAWAGSIPFEMAGSFGIAVMATHALALGLTFLPQMTNQDFMRMMFAVFIVSFLCLIFHIPLILFHLAILLTGFAVAHYWMFKVDDKLE